jgi:hypothetical protein
MEWSALRSGRAFARATWAHTPGAFFRLFCSVVIIAWNSSRVRACGWKTPGLRIALTLGAEQTRGAGARSRRRGAPGCPTRRGCRAVLLLPACMHPLRGVVAHFLSPYAAFTLSHVWKLALTWLGQLAHPLAGTVCMLFTAQLDRGGQPRRLSNALTRAAGHRAPPDVSHVRILCQS